MSEPIKEPRCDAKLKNLPEERQQEIAEKIKEVGYSKTLTWLREDGIQTSLGALYDFRSWYLLKQQQLRKESRVLQLMDTLKTEQPEISEEQLFKYGQLVFSTMSLEEEDWKQWLRIQELTTSSNLEKEKIELKKQAEARMQEKLRFEKKKWQRETIELFIDWHNDKRLKEIANSKAPKSDRTEKLGQLIFKEDW